MNYQKQIQKQKRKQMRIQKEQQRHHANSAYTRSQSAAGWKTLVGIVLLAGYLIVALTSPAQANQPITTQSSK